MTFDDFVLNWFRGPTLDAFDDTTTSDWLLTRNPLSVMQIERVSGAVAKEYTGYLQAEYRNYLKCTQSSALGNKLDRILQILEKEKTND
jgi:hypothetical protein